MVEIAQLDPVCQYKFSEKRSTRSSQMIKDEYVDPFTPVVLTFTSVQSVLLVPPGQADSHGSKSRIIQPSPIHQLPTAQGITEHTHRHRENESLPLSTRMIGILKRLSHQ
jgi:hypothetical protein